MKSGSAQLKLGCISVVVALRNGPDIYVLFNDIPAQGGITCSCLAEQTIVLQAACWRMVCQKHHHECLILDKLESHGTVVSKPNAYV